MTTAYAPYWKTKAPCHRTKNIAFTNPQGASPQAIRAAKKICEACPIQVACAKDALTAGDTLDDVKMPANGVIQAGIICRGNSATAATLARISGAQPKLTGSRRRRTFAPKQCVNCSTPMVSWTRGEVPEGKAMAYARGYCTDCRSAYSAAKKEGFKPASSRTTCKHCHEPLRYTGEELQGYWDVHNHVRGACTKCVGAVRESAARRPITFNEHACADCDMGLEPRRPGVRGVRCPGCADRRTRAFSSYRQWWMRVTTPVVDDAVIALVA